MPSLYQQYQNDPRKALEVLFEQKGKNYEYHGKGPALFLWQGGKDKDGVNYGSYKYVYLRELKERKYDVEWLEDIRLEFIDQINASKVPLKRIKNFERETWLKKAISGKAEHQDIWALFTKFWASEGLDVAVLDGHDGMGQESWLNITLKVIPARPRNFASGNAYEQR